MLYYLGAWGLPGGHLEYGETFEACAGREVGEETGLAIQNVQFLTATNDIFEAEDKHYVTVFVVCTVNGEDKQPQLLEPDKCARWEWVTWEQIQSCAGAQMGRKLFLPLSNLVERQDSTIIKNAIAEYLRGLEEHTRA